MVTSSSRCRVHHSSELGQLTGGRRRGSSREVTRHEATGSRAGGQRAATAERPSPLLVCGAGGRPGSFQCARARVLDSGSDDFFRSSDGTAAGSSYYYRRSDRELRNQGRGGGVGTTEGTAGGCSAVQSSSGKGWRLQIFIVGTAMLLCNLDRVAMGILAVPLIQEFSLSMTELGVLQSSYLWGYLVGQIPAGLASDKYGGVEVMLVGLLVWSLATCGTALAKYAAAPLTIAIASRVLMGLGSSVALPAVAATVAKEVPANQRARSTTISYALFNIGNVVANLCTPYVSEFLGWHWSFAIYGALGVVWTAVCFYLLRGARARRQKSAVTLKELHAEPPKKPVNILQAVRKKKLWAQLLILAYCHSTIGLGYFTLQSWIPAFMAKDLGIVSLKVAGLCTALVWLATAFNTAFVGVVADKLLSKIEFWKVRRIAMTISTIIPAACFFVLSTTSNPLVGVFCILIGLVSWSFDYAGFHPYIVEVSGKYSGTVLSFTNSAGVIAGIAGNIATGYLVGLEGNFTRVFRILAGVYLLSCILWNLTMKGEKLELV
ncbi:MFS general substrate transporter [Chloropicon primus]|nr:MFS general substrate transporter [Chloropicon primus]